MQGTNLKDITADCYNSEKDLGYYSCTNDKHVYDWFNNDTNKGKLHVDKAINW